MVEFSESVPIACAVARVWRALTNPREVVQWDTGVRAALDAPANYPQPGQYVRWRYRLGPLPLTLHDRPTEVVRDANLRSSILLGPFAIDETYTLTSTGPGSSELSARLRLWSRLPLVASWLEPWFGLPLARATVRSSLAAIRTHCEGAGDQTAP